MSNKSRMSGPLKANFKIKAKVSFKSIIIIFLFIIQLIFKPYKMLII